MQTISSFINRHELRERQKQIERTVEYLKAECLGLERNAQCMDPVACRHRVALLNSIIGSYDHETVEIKQALEDLGQNLFAFDAVEVEM